MEQKKMWDYFQSEGQSIFDGNYLRMNFLVQKCRPGQRVLNIGIGNGGFEILALRKNIDSYALDPSEAAVAFVQNHVGEGKAKIGLSNEIPFKSDFFDVVVMSEVLEHLEEGVIFETFSEVHRVLKKNGKFIGTVPNEENLDNLIVVCPDCGCKFHRWGHLRSFSAEKLDHLLSGLFSNIFIQKKAFQAQNKINLKIWIFSKINDLLYKINLRNRNMFLFFSCEK